VHHARLAAALATHRIPAWPYRGAVALREHDPLTGRTDLHVLRDWCWLGTASDEGALASLVENLPRAEFDPDIARLLLRTLARGRHPLIELPAAPPREGE
jgi:DNA polymerase-3 subunit epsilon